ncbi:uncharacterized protein ASPGLDRAFT_1473360 [Aspergillus glaucus CBS 516.65]|uniref:Uncharacterized protein n=1 Tax=Aspergillus glaucus CBS 516.65 TaxID=1160497 RepID=A0A1L9VLM5_ASPGL|nr:hypothetical protein ASPGLDRAFT_1473360 [Aspergillus glaucus CBS 516.65]OJJ84791.1 hypothetical protein ASPGLDRAFT_1473360 [Aspergillus glaucus CBS 516.65]
MDEDLIVNVSEDQGFVSLQPGGSWTLSYSMGHDSLPDNEAIGGVFSYQFKRAKLEWWDWGGLETHANREVKLQSWLSGGGNEPPCN